MMTCERIDALTAASIRVLEDQVFMFGERCDKSDWTHDDGAYLMATIAFQGPASGQCFWAAPERFCVELAANMLGVETSDHEAVSGASDALMELVNVACCQFLTSAFGSAPLFHPETPVATSLDARGWVDRVADAGAIGLTVDDYPVLIGLNE